MHGPSVWVPQPPIWTVDNGDAGTAIHGNGNGTVFTNDTAARGVMTTHTTPPYPSIEARLGHAGTVTLRLSVSADGSVIDAQVENSSGSSALDQAAIAWVKEHWRYTPATHDGTAVPATTEAAIRFDLKNAMH
jgi:TonB family protein